VQRELQRILDYHERMRVDTDTLNWRAYLTQLWKTDRAEYNRQVSATDGQRSPLNQPLTQQEAAYWDAWLKPPELSPELIRFFDRYVHDSRAGFLRIDSSGYLRPREIIACGAPVPSTAQVLVPEAMALA
jgi:hypothetical protein